MHTAHEPHPLKFRKVDVSESFESFPARTFLAVPRSLDGLFMRTNELAKIAAQGLVDHDARLFRYTLDHLARRKRNLFEAREDNALLLRRAIVLAFQAGNSSECTVCERQILKGWATSLNRLCPLYIPMSTNSSPHTPTSGFQFVRISGYDAFPSVGLKDDVVQKRPDFLSQNEPFQPGASCSTDTMILDYDGTPRNQTRYRIPSLPCRWNNIMAGVVCLTGAVVTFVLSASDSYVLFAHENFESHFSAQKMFAGLFVLAAIYFGRRAWKISANDFWDRRTSKSSYI